MSHSRLFLLITHYLNCSSQISKKFKPWEKVSPAVKVIVWDLFFSALSGQRPFWELRKCDKISKKTKGLIRYVDLYHWKYEGVVKNVGLYCRSYDSVVKYIGLYGRRCESVLRYLGLYRRKRESVVKYAGLYRRSYECFLRYIGLYRLSYESVVTYRGLYRRRRQRLQLADFREIQALGKVAPAVKVVVWDFFFSALGGRRPFWELRKCHKRSNMAKQVVEYIDLYHRRYESVVRLYRSSYESVVKYIIGLYCRRYESVVKHVGLYRRRR